MFAGAGGNRLGLERANRNMVYSRSDIKRKEAAIYGKPTKTQEGNDASSDCNGKVFRCVWANDWEYADFHWVENKKTGKLEWKGTKNKCGEIYKKHWNDGTYIDQDIKTVDADSIPDHDLLTAGFPCPTFSVAGKRKGFQDPRGTLFFDIARVAKAKRPRLLLLENVKGLLSAQDGYCFKRILETLAELGYLLEWQVLNSKERYFLSEKMVQKLARASKLQDVCPVDTTNSEPKTSTSNHVLLRTESKKGNMEDASRRTENPCSP